MLVVSRFQASPLTFLSHVVPFGDEYTDFIWPCVLVWILDRFIRGGRVLAFNWRFWATKAHVYYNSNSHTVRLTVPLTSNLYRPGPGTYYFLYVLNDIRFWESHPFTIAYIANQDDSNHGMEMASSSGGTREPSSQQGSDTSSEDESLLPSQKPSPSSMVFIIRPYDGFTSRLQTHENPRVLIEGPYGHTQPLHTFSSVLFITGGTGIAVPLSYLDVLLAEPHVTTVHVVWAVREQEFARDLIRTDIGSRLGHEKLILSVYVTRVAGDDLHDVNIPNYESGGIQPVRLHEGRPDIDIEVQEAAKNMEGGRLAVVTCGPPQMADDTRKSVVDALGKGCNGIEYFEESFGW